jgi:malonyl-CoA/methylmalonyl-CoA synthetase
MAPSTQRAVYGQLFGAAGGAPDRPCLLLDDGSVRTYGDVDRRAAAFAGALRYSGVEAGDRVVVQIDKSADAVALYLACLRSGAVYVPLNTAYTAAEVSFFVADARAALFVGRPGAEGPALAEGCGRATLGGRGDGTLADLAVRTDPMVEVEDRSGDDPAAMLYTSGTTGRSKGAVLSCRNLLANARALHDAWRFEPDDVLVHVLPVFHVHGLFVALHCAFLSGASVRFHHRFDVDAVRRDLRRSTVLMGVPTHYHRLLADRAFGADDCRAMRLFTSGSAPLPAAEHDGFVARTGHRIVERYGMTETMILTSNPYDGERVAGTVGFPLPGVDLRVADDGGRAVPAGEVGTVEVRGDGVFLGYWQLPERTASAFRDDGWFVTGDLGSVDDEGRLTLVGRSSDMIISGGYNVYPKEIEAVLDAVAGVDETAVVGVPDPDLGERVVAVVVTEPGVAVDEAALSGACDGVLARFKQPSRYVFVDGLPRNAMGKVQKAELRRVLPDGR